MKLKKVLNENRRETAPFMSISNKGVIRLSKSLVNAMQLKPGSEISFYNDEERPIDWYLKPGEEGCILRNDAGMTGALIMNTASISKKILNQLKLKKAVMKVSTEPIDGGFYAIITKSAK